MAVVFADLLTILQADIGDSSNSTYATQCLNDAQRRVARLRRWPELMVRAFVNTVATYSTGTVAVTENSTTVTLTGGTWPSDVASGSYRFALSESDPWYTVATRSSDSVILLSQAYVDATNASTNYVAYKAHISLASAVDRVEEMWVHKAGEAVPLINAETDETVSDFLHYPSGTGSPSHFLNIERDGSGNHQVLLGPNAPDDVYRVEYVYRKKTTDGTYSLDESRWPLVLCLAKSLAYEREHYDRSLEEMRRFEVLLKKEWESESESETDGVRVGDSRVRFPGNHDWHNYLMGYGRVADPS